MVEGDEMRWVRWRVDVSVAWEVTSWSPGVLSCEDLLDESRQSDPSMTEQ
jgi:hypothetical protein